LVSQRLPRRQEIGELNQSLNLNLSFYKETGVFLVEWHYFVDNAIQFYIQIAQLTLRKSKPNGQ